MGLLDRVMLKKARFENEETPPELLPQEPEPETKKPKEEKEVKEKAKKESKEGFSFSKQLASSVGNWWTS